MLPVINARSSLNWLDLSPRETRRNLQSKRNGFHLEKNIVIRKQKIWKFAGAEISQKSSRLRPFWPQRNKDVLEETKVEPFDEKLRRNKWNWLRYVTRMNNRMSKIMLSHKSNERRRLETGLSRPNSWRMMMMMMLTSAECGENVKSGEYFVPRGPMFHHSWYRKVLVKEILRTERWLVRRIRSTYCSFRLY